MTIGERIHNRRIALHMTMEELGKLSGVGRANIHKYEKGIITNIPPERVERLALALETTPAALLGWEVRLPEPTVAEQVVEIPVLGTIAAGYGAFPDENWTGETVAIPEAYLRGRPKSDYFILTVKGDSMYPMYLNGDKVLILKQNTLEESGQIGAILYDGELATLKRVEYKQGEDWLRLVPLNPEYAPKTVTGVDLESCRVLGIPKLLIREFE